jgi:hypothetical protein
VDEIAKMLDQMEGKGLIYGRHKSGHPTVYSAIPFVVGIFEFQLHKMDPEIAGYFDEFLPHLLVPEVWKQAPLLRTIPVGASLAPELQVLPYEQAEALVREHSKFGVAECVCRQHQAVLGHRCDKPMETCLSFGSGVDFYVRHRMGREITEDEALAILARAEADGLVLQPSASEEAAFICCCCGCCCGVLANLKRHPNPAQYVHSAFVAVLDKELCTGCEPCLDRCQMQASCPRRRRGPGYGTLHRLRVVRDGLPGQCAGADAQVRGGSPAAAFDLCTGERPPGQGARRDEQSIAGGDVHPVEGGSGCSRRRLAFAKHPRSAAEGAGPSDSFLGGVGEGRTRPSLRGPWGWGLQPLPLPP